MPARSPTLTLKSSSSVRSSPTSTLVFGSFGGSNRDGFIDTDRFRGKAKGREEHEARHEEESRRSDVALTAAGEIFAREESGPEQERRERFPELAVVGDVPAGRFAHELRGTSATARACSGRRPGKGIGRAHTAVGAAVGGFHRQRLASSWSIRARMPRRMLTSSFSSAAREKSRRNLRQQALRHARVEEAHRGERRRAVRVQRLDLVDGRGLKSWRAPDVAAGRGEPQLVGDDLHRGREVERRIVRHSRESSRRCRNARARRWRVRTSRCRTRARRRRAPRARWLRPAASRTASTRPANSRGRAESPTAATQPASAASSVATTSRTVEHSVAPDASAMASGIGKASRADEHEPGEAHREHRARRAPMLPG